MRARFLFVVAVVAALALPLSGAAEPKPAGCAGVVQATGNSCTFVLSAGNAGVISYGLLHVAGGNTSFRIDLLRGNTVVSSSGTSSNGFGGGDGHFTDGIGLPLPAGTYRCRVTITGASLASPYFCALA